MGKLQWQPVTVYYDPAPVTYKACRLSGRDDDLLLAYQVNVEESLKVMSCLASQEV